MYNTLSHKGFLLDNSEKLEKIVLALKEKNNLYSVLIDTEILSDAKVTLFIDLLRKTYSGDIVNFDMCTKKPVIMYPLLNLNEDVDRNIEEILNKEVLGRRIGNNLLFVDIHLGGICSRNCDYCSRKYKQMRWCTSFENFFSYDRIQNFLIHFGKIGSKRINLLGNIFLYPYFKELISFLVIHEFDCKFIVDYNCSLNEEQKMQELLNYGFKIELLIGGRIDKKQLSYLSILKHSNIEYTFSVEGQDDFLQYKNIIEEYRLENVSLYPYFNEKNRAFFKEYVYLDETDILSLKLDKADIFSHQNINANFFGNLVVLPNGEIFSNLNSEESIGNIEDNLNELVYKEIQNGIFWRLTRTRVEPCNDCIFRDLCPPISNYELTLKKNNLCYIR